MSCHEIQEVMELYLACEMEPDKKMLIENHLKTCPMCQKYQEETKLFLSSLEQVCQRLNPLTELETKIITRLQEEKFEQVAASGTLKFWLKFRYAIASAAALIIISIISYFWFINDRTVLPLSIVQGEQVILPDNSSIWVAPTAVLKEVGNREISLTKGEIFVKVEHGEIPFKVQTPVGTAIALGTEFCVNTFASGKEGSSQSPTTTVIVVKSGKVKLTNSYGSEIATAGESLYVQEGLAPQKIQPKNPHITRASNPVSILIDESHLESSTSDILAGCGSCYFGQYAVKKILEEAGHSVTVNRNLPLTQHFLSRFRMVILNGKYAEEPGCGCGGRRDRCTCGDECTCGTTSELGKENLTVRFKDEEINALEDYINNGGRLLVVVGGRLLGGGINIPFYNPLLAKFDIQIAEKIHLDGMKEVNNLSAHPVTQGINSIYLRHGANLMSNSAEVIVRYDGKPVLLVEKHGKGKVIVFGGGTALMGQCLNPLFCPQQKVVSENTTLLLNIVKYLSQGD